MKDTKDMKDYSVKKENILLGEVLIYAYGKSWGGTVFVTHIPAKGNRVEVSRNGPAGVNAFYVNVCDLGYIRMFTEEEERVMDEMDELLEDYRWGVSDVETCELCGYEIKDGVCINENCESN